MTSVHVSHSRWTPKNRRATPWATSTASSALNGVRGVAQPTPSGPRRTRALCRSAERGRCFLLRAVHQPVGSNHVSAHRAGPRISRCVMCHTRNSSPVFASHNAQRPFSPRAPQPAKVDKRKRSVSIKEPTPTERLRRGQYKTPKDHFTAQVTEERRRREMSKRRSLGTVARAVSAHQSTQAPGSSGEPRRSHG